jgi:hypothetical protein
MGTSIRRFGRHAVSRLISKTSTSSAVDVPSLSSNASTSERRRSTEPEPLYRQSLETAVAERVSSSPTFLEPVNELGALEPLG